MKKVMGAILSFLVTSLAMLLFYIARMPADYTIRASTVIDAPIDTVYSEIANLQSWEKWSPWKEEDPSMTSEISIPRDLSQAGDTLLWKSSISGDGYIKVQEVSKNSFFKYNLHFDFMTSVPECFFSINESENKTIVLWSMKGQRTFIEKIFWYFMKIDVDINTKFLRGLLKLKILSEKNKRHESVA